MRVKVLGHGERSGDSVVIVPWYDRADFDALGELARDDPRFPKGYEAWFKQAEAATAELLRAGKAVQIVTVRPAAYLDWLRAAGRENSAASRARYLMHVASKAGGSVAVLRAGDPAEGKQIST